MKIKQLSKSIINQIAAGEVIDRPASVVKELVENAIDAGSSSIDIIFEGGGKKLIVVKDDGSGMSLEDLKICTLKHATSKLSDGADEKNILNKIRTLGFRGEALACINEIADLTIETGQAKKSSKTPLSNRYFKDTLTVAPYRQGTIMKVENLFYKTPARLKFLKSDTIETSQTINLIKALAISAPHISFSWQGEKLTDGNLSRSPDDLMKIASRFLFWQTKDMLSINRELKTMSIQGIISKPQQQRNNSNDMFVFINNRLVKDKLLVNTIRGAYISWINTRHFPTVILFINLPLDDIDVNVHPTKNEVRFRFFKEIRQFIVSTIHSALTIENIPRISRGDKVPILSFSSQNNEENTVNNVLNRDMRDDYNLDKPPEIYSIKDKPNSDSDNFEPSREVLSSTEDNINKKLIEGERRWTVVHNFYNNYLVVLAEELIIVDQHALHERILYLELKKEFEDHSIKKQSLLSPILIVENGDLILEYKKDLSEVGIDVEYNSKGAIISAVPLLFKDLNWNQIMQEVIVDILTNGDFDSKISVNCTDLLLHNFLATKGCHSARRQGDDTSIVESQELVDQLQFNSQLHTCNHGRPTFVKFDKVEFEKIFKRLEF
ncbi:MAG: DNA mismatch repair endonuclease MutL [Alphaproteobacteria bacterium]|nr:DNA mismatch repair endonuclease MutL [Alphaproteobacteria bacterium]